MLNLNKTNTRKVRASSSKVIHGFTLVELMITVAIIGILASIAVPSYQEYIIRGRIPDATSNLATKRVQMEQFFQDNRTYLNATACTADSTSSKYFTFDCEVAGSASAFKLRAVGSGAMTGFTFTVDQSNTKASSGPSGWTSSTSCWITNKGGTC
ncbi:MAG: type IV pilin protein [Rhodoferax sp.]|uniref:type IV pilin protein n=1 Tax=Rhodoferax sp. TaxID=50421 RepID=UPI00301A1E4D